MFLTRLTRWMDHLLPFELDVVHTPGRTVAFADYLFRHTSSIPGEPIKTEQWWNI